MVVLVVKNPPANSGDIRDSGLIPVLGRSPGGGHGSPLQYSLANPMVRGIWWATVHRVTKSRIQLKQPSTHALWDYCSYLSIWDGHFLPPNFSFRRHWACLFDSGQNCEWLLFLYTNFGLLLIFSVQETCIEPLLYVFQALCWTLWWCKGLD